MELLYLKTKFQQIFEIQNFNEAPQAILSKLKIGAENLFDEWLKIAPDLSLDSLQPIFQYYMSDRKEMMQDFTPKTLAKACFLLARTEPVVSSCYDMCAGTGALTIQAWNINPNLEFICEELDERAIPFLIFNLSIRNISGTVIRGNVLTGERFKAYKLQKSEKYSYIQEIKPPERVKTDCCISNPPYNLKWVHKPFMTIDERFFEYGLPPQSNGNYGFILTALHTAKRSCLILPCSVLGDSTNKDEVTICHNIVENNRIDSIVLCPDNMFEATKISTCLMCFDNSKQTATVEFVDMRSSYVEEVREQRGQFGRKSHTNRVYTKIVKTFSDELIEKMLKAIKKREDIAEFSKSAGIENIRENQFNINPGIYIEFLEEEIKHRPYADILADINRIRSDRNACKLVINETLARKLGFEVELYEQDSTQDDTFNELMQRLGGTKVVKQDYITFTKNKGELVFKNNNPNSVSEILTTIMGMYRQHVMYLNNRENIYLAEMRDALLPELMNGMIEI